MFSFDHDAAETPDESAKRSACNPGRPIALVTLYTPNIGSYARIAKRNFRHYCDAHGYTLYVHRDIPAEIGLNPTGNRPSRGCGMRTCSIMNGSCGPTPTY